MSPFGAQQAQLPEQSLFIQVASAPRIFGQRNRCIFALLAPGRGRPGSLKQQPHPALTGRTPHRLGPFMGGLSMGWHPHSIHHCVCRGATLSMLTDGSRGLYPRPTHRGSCPGPPART